MEFNRQRLALSAILAGFALLALVRWHDIPVRGCESACFIKSHRLAACYDCSWLIRWDNVFEQDPSNAMTAVCPIDYDRTDQCQVRVIFDPDAADDLIA